ncbi:hypothetical protein ES703_10357 [subsurface metagenome]
MLKAFRLAFFIGLVAGALLPTGVRAATPAIDILHVDGTIVPIVAGYIDRGLEQAETRGSSIVIIELNTPGGLMGTTQTIVERILNAEVPIVVYVSPAGGWAASAGTFITLASHIAAMAPGSRIGAATPVTMGEELSEEMKRKVTEDAAAWIRSIAEMRGRDPVHAELAVREGKSYTVGEALEYNLIDLQADNLQSLISQLNGMKVTLATGEEIILNTEGYMVDRTEMSFVERFLYAISNPNIAYILLSLGTLGIIGEIYSPGTFFPGIIGGISLLIAFYSLGVLDAYWGGILLILLAFAFFIAELLTTTFGLFTAGGVTSLVIGSLILFPGAGPVGQIDWWLIATTVICITAFFTFVINRVIRAHRHQPSSGREELVGKTAVVKVALKPKGVVFIEGERWTAESEKGQVEPEEEVIITKVDGLKLWVTKKE